MTNKEFAISRRFYVYYPQIKEIFLSHGISATLLPKLEKSNEKCSKGTWSIRELRRQIATNLYFRSGVSKDPKKLLATIMPETNTPVGRQCRTVAENHQQSFG